MRARFAGRLRPSNFRVSAARPRPRLRGMQSGTKASSGWEAIQLFRAVIDTAGDGIVVADAHGTIQVFNKACEKMFGYTSEEILGKSVKVLRPVDERDSHDGPEPGASREITGQRKDGTTFPVQLSIGGGQAAGSSFFIGILRDLTELKNEALRGDDATRLLAQIVESSTDAIVSKTMDGIITSWNAAAERIFGYNAWEAIGQHISLIFPPDRLGEEEEIIRTVSSGESINHFETIRRRKDGTDIHVSLSMAPVHDAGGNIIGVSKTARDITERKQAEARTHSLQDELAHVARLSAMGQMSAAIAHELNQPLTAAANYSKAAQRLLGGQVVGEQQIASARDAMDKAASQIVRAGTILRYLREFVERRETVRSLEDINAVIREAVALCFVGSLNSDVKVETRLDPRLPEVPVNKVQIQQVLTNLIRNSAEAMADSPVRELTVISAMEDSDHIRIAVRDTGPGFSDEMRARLFQPFMTTKDTGMGMGLKICQSLVEAHDGTIRLALQEGPGTTFEIVLPVSQLETVD